MSEQSIQDAKWRHQDQMHPDPFDTCPDQECRAATTVLNRERAIEGMQRALRRKEVEERKGTRMNDEYSVGKVLDIADSVAQVTA